MVVETNYFTIREQGFIMLGLLCRTALSVNIYNNFFHIKSSKKRSAPQFYGLHCV